MINRKNSNLDAVRYLKEIKRFFRAMIFVTIQKYYTQILETYIRIYTYFLNTFEIIELYYF